MRTCKIIFYCFIPLTVSCDYYGEYEVKNSKRDNIITTQVSDFNGEENHEIEFYGDSIYWTFNDKRYLVAIKNRIDSLIVDDSDAFSRNARTISFEIIDELRFENDTVLLIKQGVHQHEMVPFTHPKSGYLLISTHRGLLAYSSIAEV